MSLGRKQWAVNSILDGALASPVMLLGVLRVHRWAIALISNVSPRDGIVLQLTWIFSQSIPIVLVSSRSFEQFCAPQSEHRSLT